MGPAAVVRVRRLEVVLATHNGARYLEAQLWSLWQQDRRPDRLLVFDDCSTDGTEAILRRWTVTHPHWLHRLPPQPQRLGPTAAFNTLLMACRADWIALCDQDDLWFPHRLSKGMAVLEAEEERRGSQMPLLLHSDAALINAQGAPLGSTLWQWLGRKGHSPSLQQLALRNPVTGCTILANRALLDCALPIPPEAVMHDHWLALIAADAHGLISCPEPLIAHRRHNANASGPDWFSSPARLHRKLSQWRAFLRQRREPFKFRKTDQSCRSPRR